MHLVNKALQANTLQISAGDKKIKCNLFSSKFSNIVKVKINNKISADLCFEDNVDILKPKLRSKLHYLQPGHNSRSVPLSERKALPASLFQ